jgi:hypothetical protein
MPVYLTDAEDNRPLGTLTDDQFQILADALEEESDVDQDYYINLATVEMLEARGADAGLVAVLKRALGGREDMDIRWERT